MFYQHFRTEYLNASLPVSTSPRPLTSASNDVVQRVRQAHLVTRFSDMFARDRMDAMDILRNHCDDHELNQKIVFTCVQVRSIIEKNYCGIILQLDSILQPNANLNVVLNLFGTLIKPLGAVISRTE